MGYVIDSVERDGMTLRIQQHGGRSFVSSLPQSTEARDVTRAVGGQQKSRSSWKSVDSHPGFLTYVIDELGRGFGRDGQLNYSMGNLGRERERPVLLTDFRISRVGQPYYVLSPPARSAWPPGGLGGRARRATAKYFIPH